MPEIANCPKCGATVGASRTIRNKNIFQFFCTVCGVVFTANSHLTDEQNLAAWNDQPVIQRLRAGIQNTLDLARTGLKPDHYPTELEWLQHKVNVIARELAQLLKP